MDLIKEAEKVIKELKINKYLDSREESILEELLEKAKPVNIVEFSFEHSGDWTTWFNLKTGKIIASGHMIDPSEVVDSLGHKIVETWYLNTDEEQEAVGEAGDNLELALKRLKKVRTK